MRNYYLTFGQVYRYGMEHSYSPNIHPDSYIRIQAPNYATARQFVLDEIGKEWANLYPEATFERQLYPLGELICLAVPQPGDLS